ncbi:MAG: amino acid decarboxylase [Firmicutes bacterium]|nr:amino acid decarboxylase [Bacillota bacterium]
MDFVKAYAESGISRLHMPGHKGQPLLGPEPLDLTEISGADSLYEAEGIIARSEENAARLFGAAHTFYSAEGSSLCIRAMLRIAAQLSGREHPVILAARNVHRSFVYACALLGLEAEWMFPASGGDSLCSCPITPEQLQGRLEQFRSCGRELPAAVYLTTPDYLGGLQPVAGLGAVCKKFGVPLLVDHAHGAYLKFLPDCEGKTLHPMDCGASMCCDSAHKTLPVLTGGAYLHLSSGLPEEAAGLARGAMALFGSTSPSYLILQSLDRCNALLADGYPAQLAECAGRTAGLRSELIRCGCAVLQTEPLKLVLDGRGVCGGGFALAQRLREFRVECEFCDRDFAVLMLSPQNDPRDYERTAAAFAEPLPQREAPAAPFPGVFPLPAAMTIRQAMLAPQETVPVERAKNRVCAAPLVACPPAIPIAVSGELLTEDALRLFRYYGVSSVAVVRNKK